MGQISIPFTWDPIKRQISIQIPYDVKDTGLGYKEMVIPFEYNTNPNEPDIFIPVNVGGQSLSVPINLSEPTLKIPNVLTSLGLNVNVPYKTIPWQQSIEYTGTGELNVWWEDSVISDPPVAIDDGFFVPPIIDDEGIYIDHPIYVPSPPISDPIINLVDDIPVITYPEEPDKPIPSIIFPIIDGNMDIPFIPYNGPTEEEPTPRISIPFVETPIVSIDETYLPPPIISVLEKSTTDVGNDSEIVIPFSVDENISIPYTIDPNNQNRLIIPYTETTNENGDVRIQLGNPEQTQIAPNEAITRSLANQITLPNIKPGPAQTPSNPLALLGVGEKNSDSVSQAPHTFSALSYPSDLAGTADSGHYVNFYINATNSSKYYNGTAAGVGSASYASAGAFGPGSSGTSGVNVQSLSHHRTSVAISLYIPDSMNYSQSIEWENANLMQAGKRLGSAIAQQGGSKDASSGQKDGGGKLNAIKNLAGLLSGVAGGAMQLGGYAINPQLMVLFRAIGFRSFQYDFYFTPSNESEASEVKKIIKTFRFHAHPELKGKFGVFYVIPSTFDIEFMHKGTLNTNIHKVKTCVLTNYNIDYAPFGWSTYKDGMPVQTRMSLQFQEIEIITKEEIEKGY